jgi:hypothetical protein
MGTATLIIPTQSTMVDQTIYVNDCIMTIFLLPENAANNAGKGITKIR